MERQADLEEWLFVHRFPERLRPKVQAIIDKADGTTGKKGLSRSPKEFRSYERAYLIGSLIQADPELRPFVETSHEEAKADPVEEVGRPVDPPSD